MKVLILLIFLSTAFTNNIKISSIILDVNNNPINNVNITCGDNGASTDIDGYFQIICVDKEKLYLSHIRYKKASLRIDDIQNFIILSNNIIISTPVIIYGQYSPLEQKVYSTQVLSKNIINSNINNHLQDITHKISNLNYSQGTSRPKYYQIRGLGELSQFSGEGAPHFYIGYNLDYIDLSGMGMIGNLFDVEQIEIFKGPQSSIFGQNAMGGQINITTTEPKRYKTFKSNVLFGSYNSKSINTLFSNSISKHMSYNISMSYHNSDGHIKNEQLSNSNIRYLDDTNGKDEKLIKVKINYLAENLLSKITILHSDINNKYDIWTPDNNGFITYTDYRGKDTQKTSAGSLYLKKETFLFDIISITSYSDNDMIYSYDSDWGNNELWTNPPYNYDNYYYGYYSPYYYTDYTKRNKINRSQELRISFHRGTNKKFIIGGIYTISDEHDLRDGWLFAGDAVNIESNFTIEKKGLYGQLINEHNKKVNWSMSLRYDNNQTNNYLTWSDWYDNTSSGENKIEDNNLIGANFKLKYLLTNDFSIQGFISSGYKSSGINMTPNLPDEYKYYKKEYSYNYEIALRKIKNKNRYDLSIFYTDRFNPQLRLFYQHDISNPNSFDYATFNTDKGYVYGIEIDIENILTDRIKIHSSIGILKSYVASFIYLDVNYGDREQAHAPNYTYNIDFYYQSKIYSNTSLNISFNGMDAFYFDDQYNYKSKVRNLINLSILYKINNFTFTLWTKNLTNQKYEVRGYTFGLEPPYYNIQNYKSFGEPVTSGLTISYSL